MSTPHSDVPAGAPAKSGQRLQLAILCGCLSLLFYVLLPEISVLITSSEPSHAWELFPWVRSVTRDMLSNQQGNGSDLLTICGFMGPVAALFAIYGVMLYLVRGRQPASVQAVVFGAGAIFMGALVMSPIMLSTDMYAYAFFGRLLSVYHSNAYAANTHVTSDVFLTLYGHENAGSVYGPLWTLISAGITRLGGNHIGFVVFLFRGLAALATLGTAALIRDCLRRTDPERATQGMLLFLWNPLVIIETGMDGHNDICMIGFAVLGVWLHLRGRKTGAVVAFTLSALIKFVTGMFVPLYMLMILRGMRSWRERALFIARCGACAGVVAAATVVFAKVNSDVPATSYSTSPDFYSNNFHELLFKGLRRALGEDKESVQVPIYFGSWWISADETMPLRMKPDEGARSIAGIAARQKLLVIAPHLTDWLRVYDPGSHRKGYIPDDHVTELADVPDELNLDPVLDTLEDTPMEWPTVIKANHWIRLATWGLFAAFGLLAAWKTVDFDRFLFWAAAALLASYFLIMTQMWPWYTIWALAIGALKPERATAKFAVLISACVLTLYITIGYASGDNDWVYNCRSLPATVLPAVIFLLGITVSRLLASRRTTPEIGAETGGATMEAAH